MEINSSFVLRNLYGKDLLIPVRRNQITRDPVLLNSTAKMVFELCRDASTVEELARLVIKRHGVEETEEIMVQLTAYIHSMLERGFLTIQKT